MKNESKRRGSKVFKSKQNKRGLSVFLILLVCLITHETETHIYYSNQCSNLLSPIDIMYPISYLEFSLKFNFNKVKSAILMKTPHLSSVDLNNDKLERISKKEKKDELIKKEYRAYNFKLSLSDPLDIKSSSGEHSFGEIFYEKFKYHIKNIYFKFPSEHMITGLGFSLEIQFEAFTSKKQSLIFIKLFEVIEDFENPNLNFLKMKNWSSMVDYQKIKLLNINFEDMLTPQKKRLNSITGIIEYVPKGVTDELKEYSEWFDPEFNEESRKFQEEKEFYFYTGQSTSGDCEYALIFVSRATEFIGMSQFDLMGLKGKDLSVKNILNKKVSRGTASNADDDTDLLHNNIEVDDKNWENIPDIYANFFYPDQFGDVNSLGIVI